MNIIKKFLSRIGHLLLSFVRVLRRAVCCRKRKEDHLLPMTISQISDAESQKMNEAYEIQSHWEAWPETENTSPSTSCSNIQDKTSGHLEENDFFKDMVPQIRKPKKLYIKKNEDERDEFISNRLAMDPKAILSGPDLGVIDDNPSNWEDIENSIEAWDPNQLIRETKMAERKKRLAEHQRRKQERESRRASRQDSSGSLNLANSYASHPTDQNDYA